ncbi:MAG TPA: hypothetical protein VD908_11385 [Cytophagales bacterium]|nr:hypothetical protein [Cytophagales bacterium]
MYLSFFIVSCFNCNDYYEKEIRPLKINGELKKKNRDKNNNGIPRLVIGNNDKNAIITLYDYEASGLWEFIQIGDIVKKEEGSLTFNIYRKGMNYTDIFSFDIKCKDGY